MAGRPRPRRHVDLQRLPAWARYALALATAAAVGAAALATGDRDATPPWLSGVAPPVLGVLAILVAVGLLAGRLRRRR